MNQFIAVSVSHLQLEDATFVQQQQQAKGKDNTALLIHSP